MRPQRLVLAAGVAGFLGLSATALGASGATAVQPPVPPPAPASAPLPQPAATAGIVEAPLPTVPSTVPVTVPPTVPPTVPVTAAPVPTTEAPAPAPAPVETTAPAPEPEPTPAPAPAPVQQAAAEAPAPAPAPVVMIAGDSAAESSFWQLTNNTRASVGVAPLRFDASLQAYARRQAQAMADAGRIFHSNISSLLGPWSLVGENVGVGPTVSAINAALIASPTHYENIVEPAFTAMGVGVVVDGAGRVYTAHVFGA